MFFKGEKKKPLLLSFGGGRGVRSWPWLGSGRYRPEDYVERRVEGGLWESWHGV